jgi:peptidyl-prolyl cis-trans isomerase D
MLTKFRDFGKTWIFKVFMGVLVLSFALWGIADIFRGFGVSTIATVGGTEVSIEAFQQRYQRELRNLQAQVGSPVTDAQARALGLPDRVLAQMVAEAAMEADADNLKVGISDPMLIELIARNPNFQATGGGFDRNRFMLTLQNAGLSEAGYVALQREVEIRRQIMSAVSAGVAVPKTYSDALARYNAEERGIEFIVLGPAQAGDIGAPGDTEIAAFHEAHKTDYRAPEFRSLTIVTLSADQLARPDDVAEDVVRERYEEDKARFGTPETRRVRQIVFPDPASANEALAKLKSGETFDAIMASRNLTNTDVDLGVVTRDKIIDTAIAEAAFGLAAGGTSEIVTGRFGPTIVAVSDITPGSQKTFEEVRDQIRKEIAVQQAAVDVATMRDTIEDARAGGETLTEIAAKHNLKVQQIEAVDSTGKGKDGNALAELPGGSALLAAAFESDIGIENDPLPLGDSGILWFEVSNVTAARDRPLAEVRDKVIEAWKKDATAKKLEERANAIADRVRGGASLDSIGDELGVTVETATGLRRVVDPTGNVSRGMHDAAFTGPEGTVIVAAATQDPSRAVVRVKSVTLPSADTKPDDQSLNIVREGITDDLLQQYVDALQAQLGVHVNQTVLQQTLASSPSGS